MAQPSFVEPVFDFRLHKPFCGASRLHKILAPDRLNTAQPPIQVICATVAQLAQAAKVQQAAAQLDQTARGTIGPSYESYPEPNQSIYASAS